MRLVLAVVAIPLLIEPTTAGAQTPTVTQQYDTADPCASEDGVCWAWNINSRTYRRAREMLENLAEQGDEDAAFWVAGSYDETPDEHIPIDHVQAYKWYDIAAALKAHKIAKEGRAANDGIADDNRLQTNYRDACVQYLSKSQLAQAQAWSREWQKSHPGAFQ